MSNPIILDGYKAREANLKKIKKRVAGLEEKPKLHIFLVGDNPASKIYVNHKMKIAKELGIEAELHKYANNVLEEDFSDGLVYLPRPCAVIIQKPLPSHLGNCFLLFNKEDVDCIMGKNIGKFFKNPTDEKILRPCTPVAVMELLKFYGIDVQGMQAVVVGRSDIVGKPMALLLSGQGNDATVTLAHNKTKDLSHFTRQADLIVSATGVPHLIKEDMVKQGAVVVDVGISRRDDGKVIGDVDFQNVAPKCRAISPVPGGVGPMTVMQIMKNVMISYDMM